jgi:ATP-binding cassette subfamily B protein
MGLIYKYKERYWKQFGVAVVFVTLEALCDLAQPTIMSQIIDVGVAGRRLDYILYMGGLMLLITAVGALSAFVRNLISSNVSQKLGTELRLDLYVKIQNLSFENINSLDRASLVTRLTNDVTQVQALVNGLMRISLKAPLLCIGSLILAIALNPQLAMVLAVVVPLVAALIAINMKAGFPLFAKMQKALDQENGVMREYLSGVRVVKAFNRFDYELSKFDEVNKDLQAKSVKAMKTMAVFGPGITLVMNLGIVSVLWLGGLGVNSSQMQIGHIIAFINYMTQILFSLMIISMVVTMFVRARASAERISEVLGQENNMKWSAELTRQAGMRGRIDFEDVSFSYDGPSGEPVIRNINLTCLPGETVGIIGSTGSGKSSLAGLIPRFYDATAGVVRVNGDYIKDINPKSLREIIALVPQKTVLFTGTILYNIKMGKADATMAEVERAARMAQAHEFILSFPEGYQTQLGQGGVNLSGGQKQRIAIARALIRNPDILILDDCTSAVDMATEAKIREALRKYADQVTSLVIAQRIASVVDADKIVVLDNGEIVGTGKHDELLKNCDIYREIFQSQAGKELQ